MTSAVLPEVRQAGPPRLTAGFDRFDRLDLKRHQAVHGGIRGLIIEDLVELAERIKLTGRGGAGFPFSRKLRAVYGSARLRRAGTVVVVNATEGEPASWKDKVLLARAPHLILDGAALAAHALEAREIVIGVVDGELGVPSLVHAIGERKMPAPTRVVTVPNRFISGEGGALVRGINGETPIPPGHKVLASDAGVGGLPTLLSNAETFAQLGLAARLGPSEYSSVGTATEPGTVMLTVGGSVAGPAVVETPAGVPLSDILAMCGATLGEGVLVGGFHGSWLSPLAVSQARVSREGLAAVGGALGAGVVLPLGDGTCPLGEVTRVIYYLAGQSSGQCGPCRLGLPDVARAFAALTGGAREAVDEIRSAGNATRGRGACKHPDGTVRFALSALETFTDDLAAHIIYDGCGRPVKGIMPVPNDGAGARLHVDWTRCDGHGLCSYVLREVVQLDRNGFPAFSEAPVPAWLEADARKAVRMCPALALRLTPASA